MPKPAENAERVAVSNRKELGQWLQANQKRDKGIWLVTYKKNHPDYLSYDDIVEECLCFGWIDSLPRKLGEFRTMLYISPRREGSNWSQANKLRVAKLEKAGLLKDAGWQKIERAKQDGSWTFLDDVEALIVPPDLQAALANNEIASDRFEAFPKSSKKGILEWIKNAKKPATRARRIRDTVEKAAKNIRANQ